MKKTVTKFICVLLSLSILLGLAACGGPKTAYIGGLAMGGNAGNVTTDENGNTFINLGSADGEDLTSDAVTDSENAVEPSFNVSPKGEYNKGIVLVKFEDAFDASAFGTLDYAAAEALYEGSKWYSVTLTDKEATEDAVAYLTETGAFEKVDYDYIMGVAIDGVANVTDNPYYGDQTNLGAHKIPYGWTQNGKAPGGSPDVVVAVIDTGVDYNHLDLRNNIWENTAEIPNNGKDDDSNGYIDDVYGWDCVGDDNDPMDDNGHGTHVAGIIAAENNKIGGIGVAYNCKIMVLKAGNSSGYFNNSDIAEAIQYAYMNGASVINMSFGGSNISIAVEDALQDAYNTCVLVAAAGNDGACNKSGCKECEKIAVSYPAALPYVIGVMSTNKTGAMVSGFSNYDHVPYNAVEYEVYAVGEGVISTWPNNKYASLNGTSMAAPTVSGIAALLRSYHPDRETYSTKYIQSQIVNTGTANPYNSILKEPDSAHSVADVQSAMLSTPKPAVNAYEFYIDDATTISSMNNGNGVADAGETIRVYFSLYNRGGVATNVNVSIDANRSEDISDPYFTFVNNNIALADIGTYSVRESGDKYFEVVISSNCPNDYLTDFNIRYTYKNGLDDKDDTIYSGRGIAQFNVSRGYRLPSVIDQDTVFTADKLYIVSQDVIIPKGVTVTFEAGCEIQYYDDRAYYNSPIIISYGTLNILGTKDNTVKIKPFNLATNYICGIRSEGTVNINYVDAENLVVGSANSLCSTYVANSKLVNNTYRKPSNYGLVLLSKDSGSDYATRHLDYVLGGTGAASSQKDFPVIFENNYLSYDCSGEIYGGALYRNNVIRIDSSNHVSFACRDFENNIVYSSNFSGNVISGSIKIYGKASNNSFVSINDSMLDIISMKIVNKTEFASNIFSNIHQTYNSQFIDGYYDANGNPTIDVYGSLLDASILWPYIVSIEMFDKTGNPISTVGKEEIKVRVTFNRPMDTTKDTFVTFGTVEPYADYKITGSYVSDTVWEGIYTLKAQIENGQNFLKVNNACAAEDPTKTVFGEYQLHEFTIDTTAAMSMNLQAFPKANGIELLFAQDDYDTLLGYNIYRANDKDGNYVKLNPAIVLSEENTFLDENAEPGKTYWYTYTVVLSDFTESSPAGKVMATAMDTMSPSLYHTPINQGYENNNLVITATATDNVAISKVTLYYRAVGAAEWKSLQMSKQNDKFSATIFGSEVTMAGLEYYIAATDGINTVQKGSAEVPYSVVVKAADSLLGKGDVDGNGTVNTKDALMLMQCMSGNLILADDAFKRADLDGSGKLTAEEALCILQYVNGKRPTLEMSEA